MKKITLKIISVLCAVCMVMSMSFTVLAADDTPSVLVQTKQNSDKTALVGLVNVAYKIYSAQVTLKINGENIKFAITPSDNSAYSTITQEDGTVTLYVDSTALMEADTKLNNQEVINIAELKADKALKIGDSADLILVDRSMDAHSYNNVKVKITEQTNSAAPKPTKKPSSSGGGGGGSQGSDIAHTVIPPVTEPTSAPAEIIDTGFEDVPLDFWANSSIKFVTENGLFEGTSESTFDPHAQMTRGMYVTVLSRFGEKLGEDWSIACDSPAVFSDIAGDEWFAGAAAWAGGTGLVNGIDDGVFGPYYPITREQIAVMTVNFAKLCGKNLAPKGQITAFTDSDMINEWAREAVAVSQMTGLIYGREDGTFAPQATATRSEVAAILTRFVQNVK